MILSKNYYNILLLILVLSIATDTIGDGISFDQEDSGITINANKIKNFGYDQVGDNTFSFDSTGSIYSVNHSINPAIITLENSKEDTTVNISSKLIATNTLDQTLTQHHALFLKNNNNHRQTIEFKEDSAAIGALKETGSIPVIQIENSLVTIKNYGTITGKGEEEQIALLVQDTATTESTNTVQKSDSPVNNESQKEKEIKAINIDNYGVISGDILGDKQAHKKQIEVNNRKELTAQNIKVHNITNSGKLTVTNLLEAEEITNKKPTDNQLTTDNELTDTFYAETISAIDLDAEETTENTAAEDTAENTDSEETPENTGTGDTTENTDSEETTENTLTINNSNNLYIGNLDLSKGNITIKNKEDGIVDIKHMIRKNAKPVTINNNNANSLIRLREGSVVQELTNNGKLQIVLSQAKQKNAPLLIVENTFSNTGAIQLDAVEAGLKLAGEVQKVPVIIFHNKGKEDNSESNSEEKDEENDSKSDSESSDGNPLAGITIQSNHPMVEIIGDPGAASQKLEAKDVFVLFCNYKTKKISEAYTTIDNGFSVVDAQLADALQMPNDAAKKITAIHKSIFAILDTADAEQLHAYLNEIRPDDINNIALITQQSATMALSRVKQRLVQQRAKISKIVYWNKKKQYNFWLKAAYNQYATKTDYLLAALATENSIKGGIAGMDTTVLNDRVILGVISGYAKASQNYERNQKILLHNFITGLYATYMHNNLYVDGIFFATKSKGNNSRMEADIALAGIMNAMQFGGSIALGATFAIKKFNLDPKVSLQLHYLKQAAYRIQNNDVSLTEAHSDNKFMRLDGALGLKLSRSFTYDHVKIYPTLGIAGIFALKNNPTEHKIIFAETTYDTTAQLGYKRYIELEAGIKIDYRKFNIEINYARITATGYKASEFEAGFRLKI